jgi:hypothetical protein
MEAILKELQTEAANDLKIKTGDFEENFDRSYLELKWLDKSIYWKRHLDQSKDILNKTTAESSTKIVEESLYNITDKQLRVKIDADDMVRTYQKQHQFVDYIYGYCIAIKDILKSQKFEIRDRMTYLKFKNGID